MSLSVANPIKNALLDAYGANFNSGLIEVFAGAVPASANAALGSATLLGTLTLGATAFQAASNGSMTANAIAEDSSADASGTATFFRAYKADGTTVIEQGSVGATGSGADLELNTANIVAGGPIRITSFVRTL